MRFILGLLFGMGVGISLGLLVAPKPGSETRRNLRQKVQRRSDEMME